jgi:Sec-independent protein secretion pathway component TatC
MKLFMGGIYQRQVFAGSLPDQTDNNRIQLDVNSSTSSGVLFALGYVFAYHTVLFALINDKGTDVTLFFFIVMEN